MKIPAAYERMKKNRYLLKLPNEIGKELYWVTCACNPDDMENGDLVVNIYDYMGAENSQNLMHFIRLMREGSLDPFANSLKNGFDTNLKLVDPTGHMVSEWVIRVVLKAVHFGDLSMENEDSINDICLTFYPLSIKKIK